MTDSEVIAHARTEIKKIHAHGRRVKDRAGQEYVLLEVEIAERLLDLAEAHVTKRRRRPKP
jgi:hypothetical protein